MAKEIMQVVEKPVDVVAKKRVFFGLLKNDLEYITLDELLVKIHSQSHFSILYFVLLIVSTLVCTLGLLTNSTAVVIGGMLIAPLTWPLARVGFGVARKSPHHIYRGILLLAASILIGTLSAYLITTISPIKLINEEILARTTPTLMDLFIALAAGLVAATAITQRKIADSLAGVAIAVSLMPPLCTVGITLGLRQYSYAGGALLLFAVNAACITLVTTFVISYNIYLRTRKFRIDLRATLFNLLFVILLSIPLGFYLQNNIIRLKSYNQIATEMSRFVAQKDTTASFENISVKSVDDNTIEVSADLLIPNDSAFTYQDNETLISNIERIIQKKTLLNLRIQTIIKPITKDQQEDELIINELSTLLINSLKDLDEGYKVSSVDISSNDNLDGWFVSAEIFSEPELVPTSTVITQLNEKLNGAVDDEVKLNLTFIPRLTLRSSDQTVSQEARKTVENLVNSLSGDATINSFSVTSVNSGNIVSFTITSGNTGVFTPETIQSIKDNLSSQLNSSVVVNVRIIQAIDISI